MLFFFSRPIYLYLLFLIPCFIVLHFLLLKTRKRQVLKFANFSSLARISNIDFYSKNPFGLLLRCVVIVLIVFSLSGLHLEREMEVTDFSFIIGIDNSRSMEAVDYTPTRLGVAQEVAMEFVDQLAPQTRIGVISFSGSGYIEQQITSDHLTVRQAIRNIEQSAIGGTDLYEAIVLSVNLVSAEKYPAVILLSDGQGNVGNLDDALVYAQQHNTIIHTIGIGTNEGGATSFGLSKLDESALESIAYTTGGKYYLVTNREELSGAFSDIVDLKVGKASIDLSLMLLLCTLFLILLQYLLSSYRQGFS